MVAHTACVVSASAREVRRRLRRWPVGPGGSRGTHSSPSRRHRLHESVNSTPHATLAEWQLRQARLRGWPPSLEQSRPRRRQRAQGRSSAQAVLDARQCRHACSRLRLPVDPESKDGRRWLASSSSAARFSVESESDPADLAVRQRGRGGRGAVSAAGSPGSTHAPSQPGKHLGSRRFPCKNSGSRGRAARGGGGAHRSESQRPEVAIVASEPSRDRGIDGSVSSIARRCTRAHERAGLQIWGLAFLVLSHLTRRLVLLFDGAAVGLPV
jgi:hypothetical protein